MQMRLKKLTAEHLILKALLFFFFTFVVSIILWIQIKDYYCYVITLAASKVVAGIKDVGLKEVVRKGDAFALVLSVSRGDKYGYATVLLPGGISRFYAFTVPLVISLLASLSLFIKNRRRAFVEALLLLVLSHFLYVFFSATTTVTEQFMLNKLEPVSEARLSFYQFFWKALEFTVMSFGPFLIAAYTFIRFRK